jgi:hypothetical protein
MALSESPPDIWSAQESRRWLLSTGLKATGVAFLALDAGAIAIALHNKSIQPPPVYEVVSNDGELVQKIYGIKLMHERGVVWTTPAVLILGETLAHVPSYMYAPHDGQPLQFVSTSQPRVASENNDSLSGYTFPPDRPDLGSVRIMPSQLTPKNKINAIRDIVHEVAGHRIDLSGNGFMQHAFLDIIDNDFNKFAVAAKKRIDAEDSTDETMGDIILNVKYGLTNPEELVAVLCELYTWGKDMFNTLSRWTDSEKVAIFYDVIKSQVFRGREYENHDEFTDGLVFDKAGDPVKIGFLGIDKTKK